MPWVLKCRSLSQYGLDATGAAEPSSCSSLPLLSFPSVIPPLPSPSLLSMRRKNLSFIVKVMLSHLSQSLLLSCCIPSPSTPSPPVHLHTHAADGNCVYVHIFLPMYALFVHLNPCMKPQLTSPCVYIYIFFKDSTAHGYRLKMQRSICFFFHIHQGFPDLPSRSFPLTGTIHSTTSLP